MRLWDVLGIAATQDRAAIRRAYAKALRVTNPEDDAEGFKALRAAYEMALVYADTAAAWDTDEDAFDPPPAAEADDTPHAEAPTFRDYAVDPEPVADDLTVLLGGRDAEIARLDERLAQLERALRGPWNSDEAAIRDTFAAILAAPVMGEIRVHGDVEAAVAALLAATVPRSDVILREAVTAFGWGADRAGRTPPPVAAVLARLDEWRIIAAFERHRHPLHRAWRSLTRPAGAWWSWRLAAFRPGVERGVETLLGEHGAMSPGLACSFKAESVARWRRLLAVPHWTPGMIAAIPFTLALYLVLDHGFGDPLEPRADRAIGLGILLSPCVPFLARQARSRWLRAPRPRWLAEGWPAGLAAVLFGAMVLPESRWALLALTVASALAWLWMAVAGGPASFTEICERLRASWLTMLICALFGAGAEATVLDPVHNAALGLMLALGATLMFGPLTAAAMPLARVPRWRASLAVPIVLAVAILAYAGSLVVVAGPGGIFYAATLTLVAGFAVVAAARIAGVRGNGEHMALRLTKMALAGMFVFASAVSLDATNPAHADEAPSSR